MQLAKKVPVAFERYLAFSPKAIWLGLKSESLPFWLLCGYFFFEYTRIQSILPWLNFLPWAMLSLLGAFLGFIFSKEKWHGSKLTLPLAVFLAHVFISSLLAYDREASFGMMGQMINWLLLYISVVGLVTTRKRLFTLLLVIILASFKMANHGFLSWARRGFRFERWGIAGPPGYFGDAADLAIQMLIFIPIVVALLAAGWRYQSKLVHYLLLYMVLCAFATILAAANRGSTIALACMFLTVLLLLRHRLRNLLLLTVVAGLLYAVAPPEFINRFSTAGQDRTSQVRLRLWGYGLDIAQAKPYFGIGYNNWESYFPERYRMIEVAHNSPITVAAELGFLGLALYLWVCFAVFFANLKIHKRAKQQGDSFAEYLSFALLLGLVGYMFASIFVTVAYYPFIYVQLALTAVLGKLCGERGKLETYSALQKTRVEYGKNGG